MLGFCYGRHCEPGWGYNESLNKLIPAKGPDVKPESMNKWEYFVHPVSSTNIPYFEFVSLFLEPTCEKIFDFGIIIDDNKYWEVRCNIYKQVKRSEKLPECKNYGHFVKEIHYGVELWIRFPEEGFPKEWREVKTLFENRSLNNIQEKVKCKVLINYNEIREITLGEFMEFMEELDERKDTTYIEDENAAEPYIGEENNKILFGFVNMRGAEKDQILGDSNLFVSRCQKKCTEDMRRWICTTCGDYVSIKKNYNGLKYLKCHCGLKKHRDVRFICYHLNPQSKIPKVAIGIDLGTTNSAVGIWNNGRVELVENKEGIRITPSYVYYSPSENYVGRLAIEKSGTDPENVLFDAKRLLAQMIDSQEVQKYKQNWSFRVIGHPDPEKGKAHFVSDHGGIETPIPPEKVSTDVLKSLLSDVLRKLNIKEEDKEAIMMNNIEAVITVPAYFNINQKRATMDAAKAAGITVKGILSEPVAAALAYQQELKGESKLKEGDFVFIFDLGGGTFDVTVMKIEKGIYEVIALGGDTHLGGGDFDRVLADIIEERLRRQLGNDKVNKLMSQPKYRYKTIQIAHEVKESFTQTDSEVLSLSDICYDADDEEITRKEFEEKCHHLKEKIKQCCESILDAIKTEAGKDPKDINHVLLVGGASKMKMIEEILKDIFPEKITSKTVSGDEAIAIGATLYAAKLLEASTSSSIKNLGIQDAIPLSIGINDGENKFKPMLKNNSSLPVHNRIEWETTEDKQICITIPIYEGLSEDITKNTYIGDIQIKEIPPKPAGEVVVTVFLEVDKNGIPRARSQNSETQNIIDVPILYKMKFGEDKVVSEVIHGGAKKYAIGIDLGTTNSAVGIWHPEGVELSVTDNRVTPSYVYFSPNGNYVGRKAFEKSRIDPENVFFDTKRLLAQTIDSPKVREFIPTWPFKVIGHPDPDNGKAHFVSVNGKTKTLIPAEQISAEILKSLLNDVCRKLNVEKDNVEAVIAVPAYFNTNQKRATMDAAKAAGITVKRILSEPVAAALAYQQKLKEGFVFIFDLGGGNFDTTVMKIENGIYKIIALGGDTHLGGRDFDRVLVEIIKERLQKQLGNDKVNELLSQPTYRHKLNQIAHEVKQSFTQTDTEVLCLSDICPDAEDEEVTREEFKEKSQDLQEKIRKCCESTLQDAKIKADIDPENIDHVLLVGGASKMRMVEGILRNIFPRKITSKTVSGDEAIAIGATLYAAKLLKASTSSSIKNLGIQDALPLSIGIKDEENKFKPMLKNNSSLPVYKRMEWKTTEDKQTCITIPIYEGLSEDITKNTCIGEIEINGIPPKPAGKVIVSTSLKVDENGILEANSQDSKTKKNLHTTIKYKMKLDYGEIIIKNKQKYAIGIDIGTNNSAIGIWKNERVELMTNIDGKRIIPFYACYSLKGNSFGQRALENSAKEPKNVLFDVKRLLAQTIDSEIIKDFKYNWPFNVIGYPDREKGKAHFVIEHMKDPISPEKVLTDILNSLLDDICRRLRVTTDDVEAVITVPAYFNINQKRATMEAAKAAGITVKRILSEPVAAALAYQQELKGENKLKEGESVFIFDLGGGTLDITIMSIKEGIYEIIALGGDTDIGGRKFDQVIADIIEKQLRKQLGNYRVNTLMCQPKYRHKLNQVAHDVKVSLTQAQSEVFSLSGIHPDAKDEEITRIEFEGESQHLQDKIKKCCERILRDAQINPKDIDHVILVGGASRMNAIQSTLKHIFPLEKISKTVSGDEAISIGATIYAAQLLDISGSPLMKNLEIQNTLSLPIGTKCVRKFKSVLKTNSPLPVSNTIKWKTTEDEQTCITIPIYEGLSDDIKENTCIGEIEINGIPPKPAGESTVVLSLKVDMNGNLDAEACVNELNTPLITKIAYKMEFDSNITTSKIIEKNKKKKAIGIDLGTMNSAVGIWKNGKVELVKNKGTRITPSYAYYSPDGNYIGKMAVERLDVDSKNVLFDAKRLLAETIDSPNVKKFIPTWPFKVIGHPDPEKGKAHFVNIHKGVETPIPPEKVSADVLKSLLNDVHRRFNPKEYDIEAVITVPAYFNTNQKRATMDAAKAAGINVKQILSEPVAAALAFQEKVTGNDKLREGDFVFIFDLGGGTFDITIMKIEKGVYKVIAIGGDTHLGGRDFDQVIAKISEERLRKQLGDDKVNELRSRAEYRHKLNQLSHDVKESLTQAESEVLSLNDICPDAKGEEITRIEFEENSQHLQDKIKKCCEDALHDAEIDAENISHVILVGGASRMKMITKILRTIFPPEKPFSKPVVENEAIAIGATLYAAKLLEVSTSSSINNLGIQDALPLSIGVERDMFEPILQSNSPLPVSGKITQKTTEDNKADMTIPIYEGFSDDIDESTCIAKIEINGIPPKLAGEVTVNVSLEVDENGILKAQSRNVQTGEQFSTTISYKMKFENDKIEPKVIPEDKKKYAVGIDLGTTNSAVGVWHHEKVEMVTNKERTRITPSYVYYSPDGNYIGKMAFERLSVDSKNVLFDAKRLLAQTIDSPKVREFEETWPFTVVGYPDPGKDKAHFVSVHGKMETPIPPEKISTDILKSLLNDVCRRLDVKKEDVEAVITVPAYFNMAQKRVTLEAAEAAGITVKRILSEPVAAALAYQQELKGESKLKEGDFVFIFDLGGGTFDVTVMKIEKGVYEVIALGGDTHLGGGDFDRVLADIIEERLRKQLGNDKVNKLMSQPKYRYKTIQIAHEVKESFTQTDSEELTLSDICYDAQGEEITRKEFEEKCHHLKEKIKQCCESTLQDAQMDSKDINHVLLVGGASKMKMIEEILKDIFPEKITSKTVSGDEAIAIGATLYAAKLLEASTNNLGIQDALPLSIGIEDGKDKFKSVLKNNSSLPVYNRIEWKTTKDKQTYMAISIYEGFSDNINENTCIGEIEINGIPPKPAGEVVVTVFLGVDKNGILKVQSRDTQTGEQFSTTISYKMKFENDKIEPKMIPEGKKKYAVGIDLGTTNSAVGVWHHERIELVTNKECTRITPSYVYYSPDGNYIGKMAFERLSVDPENVFFDAKRLLAQTIDSPKVREFIPTWPFRVIGHPDPEKGKAHFVSDHINDPISPENVSADILKSLLNDVCRRLRVTKDDIEVVITVPAYFNDSQRRATREAAKAAGITVKRILSEPAASALAYQQKLAEKNKLKEGDFIFIFDLGGGTFDVTIMKIEDGIYKVIALGGNTHLGGGDFDRVLAKIIEERLRRQLKEKLGEQLGDDKVNELMSQPKYRYKTMQGAHKVKEDLSKFELADFILSDIYSDAENEEITREEFEEKSQDLQEKITREEFEKKSQHLHDKIKICCENTLRDAKYRGINFDDINHVLLVGGASKMNMVQSILESIFPEKKIFKTINGDEAIARGATIYAAKLLGISNDPLIKDLKIQDALPLSVGIEKKSDIFNVILQSNSPLPVSGRITQKTTEDNKADMTIPIYEGFSDDIDESTCIAKIEINGIPPKLAGEVTVNVSLEVDESGILKAEAYVDGIDEEINTKIIYNMEFNCNIINL